MIIKFNEYENKDIIRMIRESTGLTQEKFGEAIGKSRRTIQEYESGNTTYSIQTFRKILETFNFEVKVTNRQKDK